MVNKQAADSDGLSNDGIFNDDDDELEKTSLSGIKVKHHRFRPTKLDDWGVDESSNEQLIMDSSSYVKLAPVRHHGNNKASEIVNLLKQMRYNSGDTNHHGNSNSINTNKNKMMRNRNRMIASMLNSNNNNNHQRQPPFRVNNMNGIGGGLSHRLLKNHSTLPGEGGSSTTNRPRSYGHSVYYSPPPSPLYFYSSSSTTSSSTMLTTQHHHTSSSGGGYVKQNEMYSIFVSMLTAAVFLVFIMWRWVRIKSDLRKALREQNLANTNSGSNGGSGNNNCNNSRSTTNNTTVNQDSTSSSSNHHHTCILLPPPPRLNSSSSYYNAYLIAQHTDDLRTLIAQLTNGEPRTAEEHQQILQAAKYTLQQLKQQTGIVDNATIAAGGVANSHALCSYYHHGSRRNRLLAADRVNNNGSMPTTSGLNDHEGQTYRLIDTELLNAVTTTTNIGTIPPPPTYDSLMSKSSSLPSYHNLRVSPVMMMSQEHQAAGSAKNSSSSSVNDGAVNSNR